MTTTPRETSARSTFPEGRRSNVDALAQLERATGISRDTLTAQIPELEREDLAFGLSWADDEFRSIESERYDVNMAGNYVIIRVPRKNVAGDGRNDVSGINRSYFVNVETSEIVGSPAFDKAEEDVWDRVKVAPESGADEDRRKHLTDLLG